jgi:hypothetical protein
VSRIRLISLVCRATASSALSSIRTLLPCPFAHQPGPLQGTGCHDITVLPARKARLGELNLQTQPDYFD